MEPKMFCQSCTMPIDNPEDRGTEKNGAKNDDYCKFCYRDGALINPGMTFEQMKSIVSDQMQKRGIPDDIIQRSLKSLPHLKRWRKLEV